VPYIIQNRAGQNIVIPDGALNQDFSIDLIGRNYENYGQIIAQSFIDILDNFANTNAPAKQVDGQLWFDTSAKVLRVYNATEGQWVPLLPIISAGGVPAGENAKATMYYDQTIGKLFVNDGSGYKELGLPGETNTGFSSETAVGSPSRYGTRLRNIFLEDSSSVPRAVSALVLTNSSGATPTYTNEEKILAIFSGHAEFTAGDLTSSSEGGSFNYYNQLTETGGIGATIRPGINLRADNNSRIQLSNQSYRSDSAYALNLGSFGADAANITASQVFYDSASGVPSANATYSLGNATNQFNEIHAKDFIVSNAIVISGNDITSGSSSSPINHGFFNDLTVAGNINFPSSTDVGSPGDRINNTYVNNLFANTFVLGNQTFPTSAGNNGDQIYIDGTGQMFWRRPVSNIANIFARGGTSSANTVTTVDGVSETTFTIDIGAGTGITVFDDTIAVNMGAFDTDNLSEGSTNQYFTTARARGAFTFSDAGGLGSFTANTGVVTYTGPSNSDIIGVFSSGVGAEVNASGAINSVDSEIVHDDLSGFVANEHIDHSLVLVSAGNGLVGGGNITSSITLNVVGGYGITAGANVVELANSDVVGVFSAGEGISLAANGRITNTGVITSIDTTGFVTTADPQHIGGQKTFTTQIRANNGIQTNSIGSFGGNIVMTAGTGAVTIMDGGEILATGDITAFSDETLKENIQPITNALDKLNQIRGVTYNLKDDNTRKHTGVIAQELQKVLPEAVHTNDDGILSVAYGNTIGLLIEAIKELQGTVNDLKRRLESDGDR
jgi:hypothetical protein